MSVLGRHLLASFAGRFAWALALTLSFAALASLLAFQVRYPEVPPLILVSAPPGYGKSTLVSHWLETSETASAWLSLDQADGDAATFLRYVVAAVRTLFPAR